MTPDLVLFAGAVLAIAALLVLLDRNDSYTLTLSAIHLQGTKTMAIAQDILDAVRGSRDAQDALSNTVTQLAETIGKVLVAVQGLVDSGAITADQAAAIIGTAQADRDAANLATQQAAAANQALQDKLTELEPSAPAPPAEPEPTPPAPTES